MTSVPRTGRLRGGSAAQPCLEPRPAQSGGCAWLSLGASWSPTCLGKLSEMCERGCRLHSASLNPRWSSHLRLQCSGADSKLVLHSVGTRCLPARGSASVRPSALQLALHVPRHVLQPPAPVYMGSGHWTWVLRPLAPSPAGLSRAVSKLCSLIPEPSITPPISQHLLALMSPLPVWEPKGCGFCVLVPHQVPCPSGPSTVWAVRASLLFTAE